MLKKLVKNKDGFVRGQAALALGKLNKRALPVLEKLVKDEDIIVRGQVALALGKLGEIDPTFVKRESLTFVRKVSRG